MSICRVFSCGVGIRCLLWSVHSLGKTLLAFALLHSVLQGQICLFSSVQSLSCVWLFATPWTAARQVSRSITNFWRLPKLVSIELVMPSNHLILCHLLLLLPPIPPSIRVFSNESAPRIRCLLLQVFLDFLLLHSVPWFGLEMNRDHSVVFEIASKYCILNSFVDHDGYSISSKGFLPTVVDIKIIWVKFTHSGLF